MKKKIIIICLLSILAFFIGKIAYDSFMLNSYYSHGDELIAKIEKYNMERHTYPRSLDSIGIKEYDLGGGLIYKTRVRDKKRLEKVGNLVKNSYLYR